MAEDLVRCVYGRCLHDNKVLPKQEAVLVGKTAYYHPDCHKQNEEIKEILNLFQKYIDPLVVFAQLRIVVNNIVFNKFVGSEYLLFALKYAINNKINLKHPAGLYYIIDYKNIKDAYIKLKSKHVKNISTEVTENNDNTFTYKPTKTVGFGDIIKG